VYIIEKQYPITWWKCPKCGEITMENTEPYWREKNFG